MNINLSLKEVDLIRGLLRTIRNDPMVSEEYFNLANELYDRISALIPNMTFDQV